MTTANRFVRNMQAGAYLDAFLVLAIGAILVIRFFLHLTGYPQVGGDSLHIAHMLWGGLLMVTAIVVLLFFIGRPATRLAVFLGGIGFGTFMDEVGKFVTKDNDYFFKPSVAIMYGTFVLVYVAGRLIQSWRDYSPTEYLVNSIEELGEIAVGDLDEDEKGRALGYLRQSDPANPLTEVLSTTLASANTIAPSAKRPIARARDWLRAAYARIADRRGFATLLILFFTAQLLAKSTYLFGLIFLRGVDPAEILNHRLAANLAEKMQGLGFVEGAEIVTGAVAALFILLGILRIRKSRLDAYRLFRTSILINIFFTEIFIFAQEQFGALVSFMFNILVLLALGYMIDSEKRKLAKESDR